ncbi:interferon beta-like [Apteryx rowi]|uniref:interferon beta-like n=1 Tax=Apteryx rowi TaxID=308060 RepID=UPI000E1DAC20|nr:interferon beta-like [Apteryx rowi]
MPILVQRCLLQVCITLALYIKISHPICLFQGSKVNYQNMNFLCKMGASFPQQCLRERTDFKFPMEITKVRQRNATMMIHELLRQIFHLFSKNLPESVWNASCIEKFQNGIHQQIEELETCLVEELSKGRNSSRTGVLNSTTLSVKKYFRRITNFLEDKQYSHCSWEAVRMEVRTCFIFIDCLMRKHMA